MLGSALFTTEVCAFVSSELKTYDRRRLLESKSSLRKNKFSDFKNF